MFTDGKGNKTAYGYLDGVKVSVSGSAEGEESVNKQSITADMLTKVTNGETEFNYCYDGWGRTTKVLVANELYAETQYIDDFTAATALCNGDKLTVKQDKYGNTTEQATERSDSVLQKITNTYDPETKQLLQTTVDTNGKILYNTKYTYDVKGNVVDATKDGEYALRKRNIYTKDNDLKATEYRVGKQTLRYGFETDRTPDKRSVKVELPFGANQVLAYDGLGRTKEVALGENLVKDIYYAKCGDHATSRVSAVWYGVNGIRKENTRYAYDKAGNIETVTDNGKLVARYVYDGLNRLVREDNIHFGTTTYQYDCAGNLLCKKRYTFTTAESLGEPTSANEYLYKQKGWRDQLVSFDGSTCEYDVLGNPTSYRGYKLSWQGRRLIRFDNVEYTYDADGIRTSKRDSNKQIKFYTDSNTIVAEEIFVAGSAVTERHYFYGTDGIAGFRQEGVTYLFRKNVQGDVTHIYTESGKLVGQYAYDAWGNCKILVDVDGVASVNPSRYRGYYFDYETGLYYLQTRYYDPQTCRFISADSIEYLDPETLGGLNLYAYCGNNPVMAVDPEGTWDWNGFWKKVGDWFVDAGNWINNNIIQPIGTFFKENWDVILAGVLICGAVAVSVLTFGAGSLIAMAAGAIIGTVYGAFNSWITGGDPLQGAISGLVVGAFGGISSIAGGLAAAGMSIIMDRVNGQKAGLDTLGRAAISGLVAGTFARGGNLASSAVASGEGTLVQWIANLVFASLFTLGNIAFDLTVKALRRNGNYGK